MILKGTEIYALHFNQINCLLRGKSDMWSKGFKNGLLSNKGLLSKDLFLAHLAPDYDIGFSEGVSYAIYKSTHDVKPSKTSEAMPAIGITCL